MGVRGRVGEGDCAGERMDVSAHACVRMCMWGRGRGARGLQSCGGGACMF